MAKPDDLSPEYRRLFEAFRGLGMSEREAMTAATAHPADRPAHGPLAHPPTMAESAAMYADAGHVVGEVFEALGASVVGRDGGSRDAEVRSFSEAIDASQARHPSSSADLDFGPLVVQLDPSLQKLAGELTEAGVRHVRQQFEWYSDGTFAGKPVRALELALASEARAQRAGGKAIEVAEVAGRVVVREVTGR